MASAQKNSTKDKNPYRLDRNVLPILYDLTIEPDLERFTLKGRLTLLVKAAKPFSSVTLHALDLKIRSAAVVAQGRRYPDRGVSFDAKLETVTIRLGAAVPAGNARVEIEFTGELNDKMHGFYRTSYDARGKKRWGAATQFEATDARRCFPCFDEPDLKARFRCTLVVPREYTALSNMPVDSQASAPKGKKSITYQTTPVMPTYLLCFVVAHLEYVEGKDKNGVPIRIYTTPGKKEHGRFALEVAKHTLPYFGEWFGIPYALPKLDQVALPDFASGAMENWGLVTYRETALLVDPKNSSAQAKQRVAEVIDHELAHQWFGNLVTMEWWTDLWLNEGFASYMGPKAVDHQFPEWRMWDQFVVSENLTALRDDALRNTHPIEIPVKNPHEIREIFDHITYSKGSAVNRMLEHYLGEEDFRKGLRVYLKRYAFGNARTTDLWAVLEEVTKKPVRAMMGTFTRQPGYPVVTVKGEKGNFSLSQERFLFDGSRDEDRLLWSVPVGVAGPGIADAVYTFLDRPSAKLSVEARGWVKLNPGQSGFFRAAYPHSLFAELRYAMARGALGPIDTLGVVDDTFALARAGYVPTSDALDAVAACESQNDYNVWVAAAGVVSQIENVLPGKLDKERLARFARRLFGRGAAALGWTRREGESHLETLTRSLLLGRLGHYGDPAAVAEARYRFKAFSRGEAIEPNLRGVVYGIAAEHGGRSEYETMLKAYRSATLMEEKVRLLRALTRFRDRSVIADVLNLSLSADVRSQDKYVILAGFGSNSAARDMAWKFLKKEWKVVTALFGGGNLGMLSRILEGAASEFTTEDALRDVKAFFASHKIPGTERAMKQTVEVIQANLRWTARDADDIASWLGRR